MRSLLLLVCVLAATTSCKLKFDKFKKGSSSGDAGAPVTSQPGVTPTLSWDHGTAKFSPGSGQVSFLVRPAELRVSAFGLPAGTNIKVGDRQQVVSSSGGASFAVPIDAEKILALEPARALDFKNEIDFGLSLTVTFPPNQVVEAGPVRSTARFGLFEELKGAADHPVRFPGEDDSSPKEHTVVLVGASGDAVFGPARTMREVDWVAFDEKLPERKGKVCSGYKKTGEKGEGKSYTLTLKDSEVSIFDRKSSKLVEKKKFPAPDQCPSLAFGTPTSFASSKEIGQWLRERRAKK